MFDRVFVAGTFDGLHRGHISLLTKAFSAGRRVTIGLTSDYYVRNIKYQISPRKDSGQANIKYTNKISKRIKTPLITPYSQRKALLEQWLRKMRWERKATITPIDDPYEPAASMRNLDALVVTVENRHRGEEINRMRRTKGLPTLTLLEATLIAAEDGQPISSTRVRDGGIDTAGRLVMPEKLRAALGKPLGTLLRGGAIDQSLERHRQHLTITVGDVATKTLLDAQRQPALVIVDRRVRREPYHGLDTFLETSGADTRRIASGPGFIAQEAVAQISDWGKDIRRSVMKQRILIIDGEEDLLTLPAVICAPLGSVVYYGQPGEGLVEVVVTHDKKEEAIALLGKFT